MDAIEFHAQLGGENAEAVAEALRQGFTKVATALNSPSTLIKSFPKPRG